MELKNPQGDYLIGKIIGLKISRKFSHSPILTTENKGFEISSRSKIKSEAKNSHLAGFSFTDKVKIKSVEIDSKFWRLTKISTDQNFDQLFSRPIIFYR